MSRPCCRPRRAPRSGAAPASTSTQIPGVMEVDELVDAALVGFDRREPVTIPPLPDDGAVATR